MSLGLGYRNHEIDSAINSAVQGVKREAEYLCDSLRNEMRSKLQQIQSLRDDLQTYEYRMQELEESIGQLREELENRPNPKAGGDK